MERKIGNRKEMIDKMKRARKQCYCFVPFSYVFERFDDLRNNPAIHGLPKRQIKISDSTIAKRRFSNSEKAKRPCFLANFTMKPCNKNIESVFCPNKETKGIFLSGIADSRNTIHAKPHISKMTLISGLCPAFS